MKIRMDTFPIGSSYYPPFHDPEDWERDLSNMKRAGLNTIRTAELLASWDYIEPKRGHPEWGWLDRIFELANSYDLRIVLGTGSCNPPIWMLTDYPDLQRISREGVAYPTNTMWGWACVNNPGLRGELSRYLTLLLERYSEHPTLSCWQLDNQIGHSTPFTGAEHAHPRRYGYYCYCRHCAAGFREWVRAKYGDIDTLNTAWSWDPTHYRYHDWSQIEPPRSLPAEWGNGTAWLDFRCFIHDSLTDYLIFQHQLIKRFDGMQLTMHNLYDCLRPDLGARNEPNHWDVGGVPDIIGHDIYPSENNFQKDPPHSSWFLDFAYSVAHHNNRTMWIPELESGPLGGFSAGPNFSTTALDIKRFNLACLGHGAKALLYQGYRDWNCIPLHWGGLVDFHGEPTERFHAAAEVNRVVAEHQDFFLDAQPVQAQVALYHTHENVIAIDGQANERFLYGALRGAHTALWQKGYAIQFVEPRFIGSQTADYQVILLPFVMHMPGEHAEKLRDFVTRGGSVIGFAKLAHLDEKGWAWSDRPGAGLTDLFGARETRLEVVREADSATAIETEATNPLFAGIPTETVQGYWHRQTFERSDDAEVLARFVDGAPAILRRRIGRGQAILVATHLDIAAWEHRDPSAIQLLANLVALCGARPDVVLSGKDQHYVDHHLDAHLLVHQDSWAVIINNEGASEASFTVTVPAATTASSAMELFSGEEIAIEQNGGARFTLRLAATDGAIVMLKRG